MSKYVKNLITDDLSRRLAGVNDALLVNVIGLTANNNYKLRAELRKKNIHVMVVKNSLARRATVGTPLAPLFEEVGGNSAVCWGAEDMVSLAKEITKFAKDAKFAPFAARGGVMDGQRLDERQVVEVSKWPSRGEQLSLLVGQILSPGAQLVSQLTAVGGALASQIKQKGEGEEPAAEAPAEPAAETAAAPAAEAAAPSEAPAA